MHVHHINRFFKAVREPAIPQHSHHRGRRTLQVFECIHQDEVQHYVEKVHTNHLQCSGNVDHEEWWRHYLFIFSSSNVLNCCGIRHTWLGTHKGLDSVVQLLYKKKKLLYFFLIYCGDMEVCKSGLLVGLFQIYTHPSMCEHVLWIVWSYTTDEQLVAAMCNILKLCTSDSKSSKSWAHCHVCWSWVGYICHRETKKIKQSVPLNIFTKKPKSNKQKKKNTNVNWCLQLIATDCIHLSHSCLP